MVKVESVFNRIVNFYFKNGNEVDIFIDGYYIGLNDNKDRLLKKLADQKDVCYYNNLLSKYNENDMKYLNPINFNIINQLLKNIDNHEMLESSLKQPIKSKKVNI